MSTPKRIEFPPASGRVAFYPDEEAKVMSDVVAAAETAGDARASQVQILHDLKIEFGLDLRDTVEPGDPHTRRPCDRPPMICAHEDCSVVLSKIQLERHCRFCSVSCAARARAYMTPAEREQARKDTFRRSELRRKGHDIPLLIGDYRLPDERESPEEWARRFVAGLSHAELRTVGEMIPENPMSVVRYPYTYRRGQGADHRA